MESFTEIERLQQIINELKNENLELRKHNELLQEENSKLTDMLNNVDEATDDNIEYEFVKEISNDAIVVDSYGEYEFEDYYFHDNKFYFYNGIEYRILHINTDKYGNKYVCVMNTEGNRINIYYSKFKRLYNLE